ncbi:tetratricopeptide repeat protein [Achromobacter xylosoxidans]
MAVITTPANTRAQRYIKTYLEPAPVQAPADASTDPQLSTVLMTLLEEVAKSTEGALFDIGCGKGTLLERLADSPAFSNSNWIYVAVDFDEMLGEVQLVARQRKLNRRVELITVDDFYQKWPELPRPRIYFCRNVLHELTIHQTANLLERIRKARTAEDLVVIQDLMNFQEGERNNVCWSPDELALCIEEHGLGNAQVFPFSSKSGALWFNCIVRGPVGPCTSTENSLTSVLSARKRQWNTWGDLERKAIQQSDQEVKVVSVLDLDVQYAALTRQLRDAGEPLSFDKAIDRKLRAKSLTGAVEQFIACGKLKINAITDTVNFRERGEQLSGIEQFLRGAANLAIVAGGGGIGKTTFVRHLISRRSYDKSPVIIDGRSLTDVWSFVEAVFSQVGLNLQVEVLSALKNTGWTVLEPSWKKFVEAFSGAMILFIDDFHRSLDSNGNFADKNLATAIGIFVQSPRSKTILAQNLPAPANVVEVEWGQLNPFTVQLRRFASDETVINILDDRVDRSSLGISAYPEALIAAISRHPLATRLAGDVLSTQGPGVLNDERFLLELEERLFAALWGRLVTETSSAAVDTAIQLRIPIPRVSLEQISSKDSVAAALDSSALFAIDDRRWDVLIAALELFRRRASAHAASPELHGKLADEYVDLYRKDDDPKWIRESYYHRLLSSDTLQPVLGAYYFRELVGSAYYCFRIRRHERALDLYNLAASIGTLPEDALMRRASCMVRTGQRPQGDDEFSQLFERYPRSHGMKLSYIAALIWVREYDFALEKFGSLGVDVNDIYAAGLLGRIHLGLHEYEDAEVLLRRVVGSTKLPHLRAYLDLARALQYQGAVEEERKVLAKALRHYPGEPELLAMDGGALQRLDKPDAAVNVLQPLFDLHPDQPSAAMALIKIYGRRSATVYKARQILERALRAAENTSDPIFLTMEAEVLKGEGRADAALQLLIEKTKLDDQHSLGMYFECVYHSLLGKSRAEAIAQAEDALQIKIVGPLAKNIPLQVNRARLAAVADDYTTFRAIRDQLAQSRAERFELDALDRLWSEQKQGGNFSLQSK